MRVAARKNDQADRWAGFTMNADQGHIGLGANQVRAHGVAYTALLDAYAPTDDLSPRQIARELEGTMWKAVDLPGRSTLTFDQRLIGGLKDLHAALTLPPAAFDCWVLVAGLDPARGLKMGNVLLRRFGRTHQRILVVQAGLRRDMARDAKTLTKDRVVAAVRVMARDDEGARALARNEVRRALDVINFFRPAQPFQQGWAHLPEEAATTNTFSVVRGVNESHASIEYSVNGPFPMLKPSELRPSHARLWRSASALLRAAKSGNVAELIVTAMQWSGRAEAEPRRETAFLLNAIALETLLLPIKEGELNYRLAQRTARLLGRSKSERVEVASRTKRLYGIRSKIVHSGSFTVTALELSEIRGLAVAAIVRALRRRSFWLETAKAWDADLERKAL